MDGRKLLFVEYVVGDFNVFFVGLALDCSPDKSGVLFLIALGYKAWAPDGARF